MELPAPEVLGEFIRDVFRRQIAQLRGDDTLRRLYRWELTAENPFVGELRARREEAGVRLVRAVCRLSGRPESDVAVPATLVSA